MKRFRCFMTVCVLLPLFGFANGTILGTDLSKADFTVAPGGTGTGELMLVNCGTNALSFSLEPRGAAMQGYIPGSCVLEPSWVDLSTDINAVELDFINSANEVSLPVDLRFVFPFYEEVFSKVTIGKNGLIALGAVDALGSGYATFPTTNAPAHSIAPYWGDLSYVTNSELPSRILYLSESNRLVVMYQYMRNRNYAGDLQSFEVILSESGTVTFQYDGITGLGTVSRGLQDYDNGTEANLWSSTGGSSVQLTPQYPAYYFQSITNTGQDEFSWNNLVQLYKIPTNELGSKVMSFVTPLSFFGKTFTKYRVHQNGYITLGTSTNFTEGESYIIAPFNKVYSLDTNTVISCDGLSGAKDNITVTWWKMGAEDDCFRAFLYSNGNVKFQYYSISGFPNFAGVRDPGLVSTHPYGVMTNIYYIYDTRMGVDVLYTLNTNRNWLSLTPKQGSIPANRFQKVTLTGRSTGLETGRVYRANVLATYSVTNSASLQMCPVSMKVQPAGSFVEVYGTRYDPLTCYRDDRVGPGDTVALYVTLKNSGTSIASNITATIGTNRYISLSGTNTQSYGNLPVDGTSVNSQPYILNVKTNCPSGITNLSLTIRSNGSVIRTNTVVVRVEPTFVLSVPDVLTVTARSGHSTNVTLVLSNSGNAALSFSVSYNNVSNVVYSVNTNVSWTSWSASSGISLIDPDDSGPKTAFQDGYSEAISIGFPFKFYGQTYTNFFVSVEGAIGLGGPGAYIAKKNAGMMPQGAQPIIAPFWADLTATNNSITYGRSASALTIAYRSIKQEVSAGGGGTGMSFQTILYTNGQIRLQYSTMTGSGLNQAACGIQSESSYTNVYPFYTRTIGNASMDFVNNILITPVVTYYWLRTEPFSGTIVPGGVYTNSLTCNATNLVPGVYTIELPVSYSAGTAHVPVILSVTE